MPGKLKVRVMAARDLPVMDRASDLTDAFVEVKLGATVFKTEVVRKSLNPQFNSEWFRYEVDDEFLQNEPLQFRVLDHDTYSAHDAIGKVYIDLNPLLSDERPSSLSGWFPIYDTMHGIRGDLNIIVKLDLFTDYNKFRQSSCGVNFFCTSGVPSGYRVQSILGFVEELCVNDDPEYQWIDKIRSMRASNEARQILFFKLSGELQRKIGLKVLETGGNSVLGYRQYFDLEGESGVVVRAIGTSVLLIRHTPKLSPFTVSPGVEQQSEGSPVAASHLQSQGQNSPQGVMAAGSHVRRSSDSDVQTPPKSVPPDTSGSGLVKPFHQPVLQQQSVDMLEYPFFSIRLFPPGFIVHLGGIVSARSVKLLDRIHNPDEPETRDAWWTELRTEIRSHARAIGCHAVIGYSEQTTICNVCDSEEIIILSATGTAAIVNLRMDEDHMVKQQIVAQSLDRNQFEQARDKKLHVDVNLANQVAQRHLSDGSDESWAGPSLCYMCHVPYRENSLPFPVKLHQCAICKRYNVPDVLFLTIEPPSGLLLIGKGCLVQARICRPKKEAKSEQNAKEISDSLPFMEYELHKQLLNKLKLKGMNTLFCMKVQVTVGERLLIAVATATAAFVKALPPPAPPRILGKLEENDSFSLVQQRILQAVERNKSIYGLNAAFENCDRTEHEDEESFEADLATNNKDVFVLEVDDLEDSDVIGILLDGETVEGFDVCSTEKLPGCHDVVCNLQMFTRVWRGHLSSLTNKALYAVLENIVKGIFFKLRHLTPAVLSHIEFDIEVPGQDEVQISINGMCSGLGDPNRNLNQISTKNKENNSPKKEDLIFKMDEENKRNSISSWFPSSRDISHITKYHVSRSSHHGVQLTPLGHVVGARIICYNGHINFFFIRESTSVKETGGLNGFLHSFLAEVNAICRAHVVALGGNALVAYYMSECVLENNLHKNQSQCLVNVCGDVATVSYDVTNYSGCPGFSPHPDTSLRCSPILVKKID